jgi:RNA polymerase sigma-70 factor, ECF subfamily
MGDAAVPERSEPSPVHATSALTTSRVVDAALLRELVDAHHRFIWRLLGRLGISDADLDDATQQVFMVLTVRKDLQIELGSERAFLFGVALKVARTHKRTLARRRETSSPPSEPVDLAPSPEALVEQNRARRLLDDILESMPMDLRVPFILFELDDISTAEIGTLLDIPAGTVASRLRRAREWFDRRVQQMQARDRRPWGKR